MASKINLVKLSFILCSFTLVKSNYFEEMPTLFTKDDVLQMNLTDIPCMEHSSCDFSSRQTVKGCYCDEKCEFFNDCCMDYKDEFTSNTTKNLTWNNYAKTVKDQITCTTSQATKLDVGTMKIAKCKPQNETGISSTVLYRAYQMLCESPTLVFLGAFYYVTYEQPVSDAFGFVYTNLYCALCNGLTPDEFTLWKIYTITEWCFELDEIPPELTLTQKLSAIMMEKNCPYHFIPPDNTVLRTCLRSSNNKASPMYEHCKNNSAPVEVISTSNGFSELSLWKNIYCWTDTGRTGSIITYINCPNDLQNEFLKESLLQTYRDDGGTAIMTEFNVDIPMNIPEPPGEQILRCPDGYISHRSQCQILEKVRNAKIDLDMRFVAFSSTPTQVIHRSLHAIVHMFQKEDLVVEIDRNQLNISHGTWNNKREACMQVDFRFKVRTLGWMTFVEKGIIEQWIENFGFRYDEEDYFAWDYFTIVRETPKVLPKLPLCHYNSFELESVVINLRNQSSVLFNASLVDQMIYSPNLNGDIKNCTSVIVHTRNNVDEIGRVVLDIVSWNCMDDVLPERRAVSPKADSANNIIYVCTGFSLSSLAFAMFYNIPNLEFQSLSGYNFAHTMITCILSLGGMFICPMADDFHLSRIALKHSVAFFWLCSFTWGTISAFHFWYLFAVVSKNPKNDPFNHKIFSKLFFIIGYGLPLLFMLVIITLGSIDCCDVKIDYDGFGCMPLSSSGLFSLISCSFFLFVAANLLFLAISVFHISELGGRSEWFTFLVFYWVQVGFSAGLTIMWSVNLMAQYLKSSTLWNVFLILCCVFGVEVNVVFVLSRKYIDKNIPRTPNQLKW